MFDELKAALSKPGTPEFTTAKADLAEALRKSEIVQQLYNTLTDTSDNTQSATVVNSRRWAAEILAVLCKGYVIEIKPAENCIAVAEQKLYTKAELTNVEDYSPEEVAKRSKAACQLYILAGGLRPNFVGFNLVAKQECSDIWVDFSVQTIALRALWLQTQADLVPCLWPADPVKNPSGLHEWIHSKYNSWLTWISEGHGHVKPLNSILKVLTQSLAQVPGDTELEYCIKNLSERKFAENAVRTNVTQYLKVGIVNFLYPEETETAALTVETLEYRASRCFFEDIWQDGFDWGSNSYMKPHDKR